MTRARTREGREDRVGTPGGVSGASAAFVVRPVVDPEQDGGKGNEHGHAGQLEANMCADPKAELHECPIVVDDGHVDHVLSGVPALNHGGHKPTDALPSPNPENGPKPSVMIHSNSRVSFRQDCVTAGGPAT